MRLRLTRVSNSHKLIKMFIDVLFEKHADVINNKIKRFLRGKNKDGSINITDYLNPSFRTPIGACTVTPY